MYWVKILNSIKVHKVELGYDIDNWLDWKQIIIQVMSGILPGFQYQFLSKLSLEFYQKK